MNRTIAAATLALALALFSPAAANATPGQYPPVEGQTLSASTVEAGCDILYTATAGYFQPGEAVTLTVSGEEEDGLTAVTAGYSAKPFSGFVAQANGSLKVSITTSAKAAGEYELISHGTVSPARGPLVFEVDHLGCGAQLPAESSSGQSPQAMTAAEDATPFGFIAPAMLAATGAVLTIGLLLLGLLAVLRRRRSKEEAS